jgi:DNA-binding NtrC family response regulator
MRLQTVPSVATLLGKSPVHLHVLDTLDRVAATDAEVLISGATGSGKELYAIYLHQRSHRSKAPFIPVNCGGLPSDLIENELFGHVGGAFTGARPQSAGLVAEAEGGTLFLDEVDSLPLEAQAKLLRVSCRKRSIAGSVRQDCGGPICASSPQRMPTSRRR